MSTDIETQERVSRLEETVKHLVQLEMDRVEYSTPDTHLTMYGFAEKEKIHRTVFKKFLHWMAR